MLTVGLITTGTRASRIYRRRDAGENQIGQPDKVCLVPDFLNMPMVFNLVSQFVQSVR